jgi:hypothetical protein
MSRPLGRMDQALAKTAKVRSHQRSNLLENIQNHPTETLQMLFIIIAFIAGVLAGQWIFFSIDLEEIGFHLSINPKLIKPLVCAWSLIALKAPDIKKAIATISIEPLQKKAYRAFKQLAAETGTIYGD